MAQEKPKQTAVVILNYNGQEFLEKFLPDLLKFTTSAEIIVADNNSTDNSLSILKAKFPNVRIIEIQHNLGFAGGYNYAINQLDHEYIAFVNSDIEVSENWLDPLVQYLETHKDCAAVQPKIMDFHNRDRFEYAGAAGGYLDRLGIPFCRGRVFDFIESDTGQYDNQADVDWVSGACMVMKRQVFIDEKGFDETFFAHMEEIDLCWRIRNQGHRLTFIPDSKVYHVGGGTLPKSNSRKTYLNFRNSLTMLTKNSADPILLVLLLRVLMDWIAGIKLMIDLGPPHLMAVLRAHLDYMGRTGSALSFRKKHPRFHHSAKSQSVVLSRYLLGKKTYEDINRIS